MKRRIIAIAFAVILAVSGSITAALRISAAPPAPQLTIGVPASLGNVPGQPAAIPLPGRGSFAVATDRDGVLAGQDADAVHPMASVAKTMTALVVLDVHPLVVGSDGPSITVSAADVALFHQIVAEGGTFAPVEVGEQLTERQILEGMMLPSANNFAVMAANWIDGRQDAFVARLNAKATALGMAHAHFADPDGLLAATSATASDLLILGRAAVASPALLAITTMASATLPDGSVITNIDTLVGSEPGWLGVKTGHTDPAGYCLLFAARRQIGPGAPPITVVGVVLGQAARDDTFTAATAAADAVLAGYALVDLSVLVPEAGGHLSAPWGEVAQLKVTRGSSTPLAVRRGHRIDLATLPSTPTSATVPAATEVGVLRATADGQQIATWKVSTTSAISGPGWWWRLWHD